MDHVFLLQHVHVYRDGEEDVKCIGIYRTREAAEAAVARLKSQPGFRDDPGIVENGSGFNIDRYVLDMDHWSEGFDTVYS